MDFDRETKAAAGSSGEEEAAPRRLLVGGRRETHLRKSVVNGELLNVAGSLKDHPGRELAVLTFAGMGVNHTEYDKESM